MKIEVKNLVKKFKSTIAVDNISFIIEKNKTLGLLGLMDAEKQPPLV